MSRRYRPVDVIKLVQLSSSPFLRCPMQLGFVSAIVGELSLEEVFALAADEGFSCVELMCWPPGKADRRYAGVTHLDVSNFTDGQAAHVRELTRMISYAERYNSTGSVLYFDVNGMKAINDRLGHAAGDAALAHFARLLVENVRDTDVVGRLGGDEFGVILAQADERQAQEKASVLVHIIDVTPFDWKGEMLTLSCAVGIHQFLAKQSAETAITAADANMYKVKRRHYEKKARVAAQSGIFYEDIDLPEQEELDEDGQDSVISKI